MTQIFTVLNTPFRGNDTLDLEGLAANVAYAINAGVAGFLIPGLASEVSHLSAQECDALIKTVTRSAPGYTVIGGLGTPQGEQFKDTARRYLDLGCHGLLVNGHGQTESDLLRILEALDRLSPDFLMLQDWDATGSGIPVPTLKRLVAEVPSLSWLKIEVIPAGPKYSELLTDAPEKLRVAGGWAVMQMIEALDRGVHAIMPTGLHRTYVRIASLHAAGRRDESRALFARLVPILAFSNQSLAISVAFFKRLLRAQSIYSTPRVRMEGAHLDAAQEHIAAELIHLAIDLESECA